MGHSSHKKVAYRVAHRSRWMNTDWVYMVPYLVIAEQAFGILHWLSEFE
jgi:hypothetical protein